MFLIGCYVADDDRLVRGTLLQCNHDSRAIFAVTILHEYLSPTSRREYPIHTNLTIILGQAEKKKDPEDDMRKKP